MTSLPPPTTDADAPRTLVAIDGEPTPAEEVAIATAISSVVDGAARRAREPDGPPADEQPAASPSGAEAADDRDDAGVRGLEAERRCPVCTERYDSRIPLDGRRTVTTAAEGQSTICFDPVDDVLYVHSPR